MSDKSEKAIEQMAKTFVCETCGGSGKISKYVKSILGNMEFLAPIASLPSYAQSAEIIK
jgi:hypothetical protein